MVRRVLMLMVPVLVGIGVCWSPGAAAVQPLPQNGLIQSDDELHWVKIPLRYVSARRMAVMTGGAVVPSEVEGQLPKAHTDRALLERFLAARPLSSIQQHFSPSSWVPEGISAIIGIPSDNSLLVRGVPEDIVRFRQLLMAFDIPEAPLLVRVVAGPLVAEGRSQNGGLLRLADVTGPEYLDLQAVATSPRLREGRLLLSLKGELRLHGRALPIELDTTVEPGKATTVFRSGAAEREIRVEVRVSRLSSAKSAY